MEQLCAGPLRGSGARQDDHPPLREGSGPSQRQLRVGELIRHALAEMLTRGEMHDDCADGDGVTIPEVRMSPDLRQATIYVMPLGGGNVAPVLAALRAQREIHPTRIAPEA